MGPETETTTEYRQAELDIVCREVYFCKFCGVFAKQPVLNIICGHIFCWPCLYCDVKRKRREGGRQCCPLCDSHLNISPPTSTIIRVCSGPQPGFVACAIDDEYEARAKEAERNLKVKGVPPRPWYLDASHYSSLSQFMGVLFIVLDSFRAEVGEWCQSLCDKDIGDPELFIGLIQEEIDKVIEKVGNGRVWLKGEENSGVPNAISKRKTVVRRRKRNPSGKVKVILRQNIKLRLSSHIFFDQMPSKYRRLKQQKLLHQPDDSSDALESFSCTICSKPAYEPVVIKSGHLFCWTCLRGKDRYPFAGCPVTKLCISTVSGDTPVSSLYFTNKDYEKEDGLLVANRQTKIHHNQETGKDITCLPSRPHPIMIGQFIEYMITGIKKEGDTIMELLDGVIPNWNDNREKVERICKEVRGRVDALFAWLIRAWCAKCKEQQDEQHDEVEYGLEDMINDIIEDEYYYMAWDRLEFTFGHTNICFEDGLMDFWVLAGKS